MRFVRTYVLAFVSPLSAFPAFAQQTTTPTKQGIRQALTLLQSMPGLFH